MMAFAATDLDILIGEDDFGIDVKDTDFAMAYFKSLEDGDSRKWLNIESTTSSIDLKGLPSEITIEPTDIGVYINQGLGDGNESVVNLSGDKAITVGGIVLDNDGAKGEQITVDLTAKLAIDDYFYLEGDFSVEKMQKNLALSDENTVDTNIFTFGGNDVNLFAGVNRDATDELGLNVTNADFAVAVIKDTDENKYTAVSVDAQGAALVGIDSLTLEAGRTLIDINKSKREDGVTVDFETTNLDVRTSGTTSITMDTKGIEKGSFDATVNDAKFIVDQYVHISGSASLSLGKEKDLKVQSATAAETELSLKDIKASYIEVAVLDADVFVGYGDSYFGVGEKPDDSVGLYLNDVDVALASYKQLKTSDNFDNMSFTSLKATAANAGILGTEDYLKATLAGVVVDVNIGKSSNTLLKSYVDYKETFGDSGRVFTFEGGDIALDYDTSIIGVSVSNAHLELSEFLYLDGAVAFTKNTTLDATINNGTISSEKSSETTLDVMTISGYNLTGFVGVGGHDSDDRVGVEVKNASFAGALMKTGLNAPAHLQKTSFLAAKATIDNAGLIGMEEVITADFQDIEINLNTGKSPLNTTVFEPLPNVDFKASTADNKGLKVKTGLNSGNDVEGEDYFMLDFDKEIAELSIGSADLSVLGVLQARGAITIAKKNEEVYLKGQSSVTAMQSLSLGMKDMDAFVGVGDYFNTPDDAVGFKVDNLDLGAVIMAPADLGSASPVQYFAINSSLDNASLIGMGDALTVDVSNFTFKANVSVINGQLGGVADPVIDFSKSGENDGIYQVKAGSDDNLMPLDYDTFLLKTSGHIILEGYGMFELDTHFDLEIEGTDIGIFIGDGKLSIGTEDTFTLSELNVDGVFALNSDGIATHFELDSAITLAEVLEVKSDLEVNINTMGKDFTYQVPKEFHSSLGYTSVTVSATPKGSSDPVEQYLELSGTGNIDVVDGILEVNGDASVLLIKDGSDITQKASVDGRLKSDLFNSADAIAEFAMTNEGAYGSVLLSGDIISTTAFILNGHFVTQFNTTNSKKTVRDIVVANGQIVNDQATKELEAKEHRFAGAGEVVVAGMVALEGDFDMAYSIKGIEGDFDLELDLSDFGEVQVAGALAILNTDEGPIFALNGTSSLSIGADIIGIKAAGNVQINTSDSTDYAGVKAGTTFLIDLEGGLNIGMFNLVGAKGNIAIYGNEFKAEIEEAGIDLFGILDANFSGYITSGGEYKFAGESNLGVDLGVVWMKAGVDVEFSNNGFIADVDGGIGATASIPYFYDPFSGDWEYKDFSASIDFSAHAEFTDVLMHLSAEIDIMGVTISGEETFFNAGNSVPPPVIASQQGSTLYLNTGERASYRGDDYLDVVDEKYEIDGEGGSITVKSLGVEKSYSGITKIVSYSGDGDDFVLVNGKIDAALDFDGGDGDDSFIIYNAGASSVVKGGKGDDYYLALSDKSTGRFYGGDDNDTFIGGEADDIIDLGTGYNTAYGGAGNDKLILDVAQNTKFDGGSGYDSTTLTTSLDEFEIDNYTFKSEDVTLEVTSKFDELNINNTASNLHIKGGNSVNTFAKTNINVVNSGNINLTGNSFNTSGVYSLKTSGDIDVNGANLISPQGTVHMEAASIIGDVNSELDALSIKTTNASKTTNLVINEKDNLTLVKDGISLAKGSLDIDLAKLESDLVLKEGVIKSTGDINIVADDIDFVSGENKVSSTGEFNITTKNSIIDYKIGGAAESIYDIDYSGGDPTGYLNFSQTDLAALKDGFDSINIGDVNDTIFLGDMQNAAILNDELNLVANKFVIQGNATSNSIINITTNTLEVDRQNKKDPLGLPDSGLTAQNLNIDIDEQFYLGGWLKANDTLNIDVKNTDGVGAVYNLASGLYSFIGDRSGELAADDLNFSVSGDMRIGSKITGKDLDIDAGGFVDITQAGRVIVNEDNGIIDLNSQKKVLVNGVLSAGAKFDEPSGKWIKDGENVDLRVEANGELKLSGAISASGDMSLIGGSSEDDYSNFFDTIPGSTIATINLSNLSLVKNSDLEGIKKLFEENQIDLGDNFEFSNIESLKGFYDLTEAQKAKVAASLGYETKTGTFFFNPEADSANQLKTDLKAGHVIDPSGYTKYSGTTYINKTTGDIVKTFIQGQAPDYSNAEIDWADAGVPTPSNNASFSSLSFAQKEAVADYLGYKTSDGGANWVNLGADFNDRYKTTFTQAYKIDYANDQIAWGDAGNPSINASFSSLTSAQKAVVAHSLGYDVYANGVYVNLDADEGYRYAEGLSVGDYAMGSINWGGVETPSETTSFGELTEAQKEVVLNYHGFTKSEGVVLYYNYEQNRLVENINDFSTVTWDKESGVKEPIEGTEFSGLDKKQTEHVLKTLGFVKYEGQAYVNKDGVYRATFVFDDAPSDEAIIDTETPNGDFSYENEDINWSKVTIPTISDQYKNLEISQQAQILNATGYQEYRETTIYYDADNENPYDRVRIDFEFGADYSNKDVDFGNVPLDQNRWLIDDKENGKKYIIYAQDTDNDGTFESLKIQDAAKLTGQRGFGILMNGTLTSLKDNADLVFSSDKDTIFRGGVNIMGENSSITLQSDKWVYAEGQFDVTGDINILGGVALDGTDMGGSNEYGDSVYVGKTTTLNTKEAGSTITIKGSKDVDILGVVAAGGTIGETGITFSGPDSSVVVEAGEQVFVDSVLTSSANISITSKGDLSEDDENKSVILTTGAGLSTAGITTHETNGGEISVKAKQDVSIMSMVLAGGNKSVSDTGIGYDVEYSDKFASLKIVSENQVYIGGMAENKEGELVEVGSTLTATGSIYVEGGDSIDGNSIILPGSAKLVTNFVDSDITLKGTQNVLVNGVIAAGGEAVDVYDEENKLLGTQMEYFVADKEKYEKGSSITIEAGYQAKIARSLYAGLLIDVRGGKGDVFAKENAKEGEELSLFVDRGVVVGSTVNLQTSEENSKINLSASGNLIITAPIWTQEISAQGFAKHANGVLDEDVTIALEFQAGDNVVKGEVELFANDTKDFENLLDLKNYLESQIHETTYSIVSSTDEDVEVGTLVQLNKEKPELNINLDDGVFEFVSNGDIKILTSSINAELIGLDTSKELTSIKAYAIDASTKGSSINIGKAGEASGDVEISGKLIAYDGINFGSGEALDGFSQEVKITSSAILETLHGGMVINPGEKGEIYGTFIARGEGATIEVNTTGRLDLHGSLIAQEGISIFAGKDIKEGEVSVQTYASGVLKTLSDDSTISIIGVNDVNIDTTIGQDGADLKYVEVGSTDGTLTLDKDAGRIITTGQVVISGNDLVLAGVIESDYYTDKSYDYELEIKTKGDIDLSGVLDTKGSMLISGGGNVDIYSTNLIANESGDKIEIYAGENLNIGTAIVKDGEDQEKGVIVQADESLQISAGGVMNLGYDFQGYVGGEDSELIVNAGTLNLTGTLKAGSTLDRDTGVVSVTGQNANAEVYTDEALILGGQALDENLALVTRGANLIASGSMEIGTGANEDGVGLVLSNLSAIRAGDDISVSADGAMQLDGVLKSDGESADLSLKSDGLMYIDTYLYAAGHLSVMGGTSEDGTGLYLEEFTFDDEGNRLTGGTLDTDAGGTITVGASENVFIKGVVGQLNDANESKTDTINLVSDSGAINILQSIDAINSVTVNTKDLNLLQSTSIATSSDTGSVTIDASGEVYIQKAQNEDNFDAQITSGKLDIDTNSFVHDGIITLKDAAQDSTIKSSGDTKMTGIITVEANLEMQADNMLLNSQAKLDVKKDLDITTTGEFTLDADSSIGATKTILIPKFVTVEKTIKVPGGTQKVQNGTYTVKVSAGMEETTTNGIIDYESVDVGDKYFTMDIALTQEGYWNSNGTFKETFIEGIDYSNSEIPGLNAFERDYKKTSNYKTWQNLSESQRDIILNKKGYKKAYSISITNIIEHKTENGVITQTSKSYSDLPWYGSSKKYSLIDVDGFRDKYINIEPELQDYILSTEYKNTSNLSDEYVGYYWDEADVEYKQTTSTFTGDINASSDITDKTGKYATVVSGTTNDDDDKQGLWRASYDENSGDRYFNIKNISSTLSKVRDPNWVFETSDNVTYSDVRSNNRFTDQVTSSANWKAALTSDTASFVQTSKDSAGINNVGTYSYTYVSQEAKQGMVTIFDHPEKDDEWWKESYISLFSNGNGTTRTYDLNTLEIDNYYGYRSDTLKNEFWDNEASSYVIGYKGTGSKLTSASAPTGDSAIAAITSVSWGTDDSGSINWGSFKDNEIDHVKVTGQKQVIDTKHDGIIQEKYYDYDYHWKSKSYDIYDARDKYNYSITTQNEDIFDKKAIWGDVESKEEKFTEEERTKWKTVQLPDVEQTVLFTERREVEGEGRSVAQFGEKSITATNITINAKNDVNIKGAIKASEDFTLDTKGAFTIDGMTTKDNDGNDIELISKIDAKSNMTISSDKTFTLSDKSEVVLSDASGTVTLDSDATMTLDGEIIAGATLNATAGDEVELKSKIVADTTVSIEVTNSGKTGKLTTNEEFVVDTVDLTLSAGDNGGDLIIKDSILKASNSITLDAKSATVTAPKTERTIGENTVDAGAVIVTDTLNIDSKNGIELEVKTNKLNAKTTGTGDIDIINLDSISLDDISSNDGAINIVAYGDIDAKKVNIASDNKRANLNLTGKKIDDKAGTINIGDVSIGSEGTITLTTPDKITQTADGELKGHKLVLNVPGAIDLRTNIDIITFENKKEADVTIEQISDVAITFDGVKVANGTLDIKAGGDVILKDVEMLTSAKDVSIDAVGDISVDELIALGAHVSLKSGADITESGNDADADIIAKTLSLEAVGDISDLEVKLDGELTKAVSTGASVAINGIDVDLTLGEIGASDTIDIVAQKNILTKESSSIVADTVKLLSQEANINIVDNSTFSVSKGVSLIANEGIFDIYEFKSGTELTQYETSGDLQFGDSSKLADVTSETIILKTSGNIIIEGTLNAQDKVVLQSDENVSLYGIKGISGNVADVSIIAKGTSDIKKGASDAEAQKGGNIIVAQSGESGTGFEVDSFELRANNNVIIDIDGDLELSGFIGGLEGFDSNENVMLRAGSGDLSVSGSIVSAKEFVDLQGDNIVSDISSVFMGKDLKAKANGDVSLNTAIDTLEVDSLENGDITINEADNIILERMDARDGFIKVNSGGDITAEIVRTHVDDSANIIELKATGTIYDILGNALSDQTTPNSVYDRDNGIIRAGTFSGSNGSVNTTLDSGANISSDSLYMDTTPINGTHTISGPSEFAVIKLPVVTADFTNSDILTIASGTGSSDNLTVVAPINVGLGSVVLNSGGAISLGDTVTANKATISASGNVNMESQINTLELSVSGTGDVNISQSGDLTVENFETNGGDVYFYVDGDVVFNNVTGSATSFTVEVSDGHSITVNGTTYNAGITSFKAVNGTVTADINMTSLDLESSGDIDLSDSDGFELNTYVTSDRTSDFSIKNTSGTTTINADISREGVGTLSLETGALTLKKSISSDTTVLIDAKGDITLDPYVNITTSDDAVTLQTTGAITISNDSVIDTGSAEITLSATNDIKVGKLKTTTSDDVTITSTAGAILDSGKGNIDIDALNANLVLGAKNGIGATDGLETDVATISINNVTSGDVNIEESNNLTITSYTNNGAAGNITTINGDMVVSAINAGSSSTLKLDTNNITLNGAISTSGASVDIVANEGDITIVEAITAGGNGNISLQSVKGKIDGDFNDDGELDTTGDKLLQAQNGRVSLDAYGSIDALIDSQELYINSTSKADINVKALQNIDIYSGNVAVVNIETPSGEQAILSEFDTGDKNIDFTATDLDIQHNVKTTGDIEMKTKSPATTLRFGSTAGDKDGEYTLDLEESKRLGNGIDTIKVGSEETTGDIVFGDDTVNKNEDDKITIQSKLEITTGGKTYLNSNLEAESIKLYGPHYTLALNADMSSDNEVEIHDSLKVGGDNSIVAGTYIIATSNAVEFIQGDSQAGDDKLTLNANGGNISIAGNIGASAGTQFDGADVDNLEEFNIIDTSDSSAGAIDVNIAQDLYVDGDVTIYATGDITFGGVVNITGSFNVIGANSITFASTVTVTNDMSLEANEIDFNDVANSVDVDGEITLKATDLTRAVLVAQDTIKSNALNIDADDLASIADGFSAINFGKETGGDVKLSTSRDFDSGLGLYGKNITIQDDDTNTSFDIGGDIDVKASKNITVANDLLTDDDVSLKTTAGKVKLNSDKTLQADDLVVEANSGITLAKLNLTNSVSATNSGSGAININILDGSASNINVLALDQTDAANSGDISLTHENGSVIVSGANVAGTGDVEIIAQGGSITLNDTSTTGNGDITLDATDNITIDVNSNMSTTEYSKVTFVAGSGTITQNSNVISQGGLITYDAGANITMAANAVTSTFDPSANDAKVIFEAGGDVALGSIGADGIINITAGGAISDSDSNDDSVKNLFGDSVVVTLEANNAIGASGDGDLDSDIASLSALNKVDNGIYLEDQDDLLLNSSNIISKGETGNIELTSTGGDITIANTIVNNAAAGAVKLKAQNIIDGTLGDETLEISGTHLSLIATTGTVSSMNVDSDSIVFEAQSGDTSIVNSNTMEINSIKGGTGTFDLTTKRVFANATSFVSGNIVNINLDDENLTFGSDVNKITTDINTLNLNFSAVDINIDETDDLVLNTNTADKITLKGDNVTVVLADEHSSFGSKELAANTDVDSLDLTIGDGVIHIKNDSDLGFDVNQREGITSDLLLESTNGDITLNDHINISSGGDISYKADELIINAANKTGMFGSNTNSATTELNKLTGDDFADIYINEADDLILNIQSANDVDIKTTLGGISVERSATLDTLKLDQQSIINNAITDNLNVNDMNLIANSGIDIDLSEDTTLTLESNNGNIEVTNTHALILGGHEDKDTVYVNNDKNIDISAKSITFNTNDDFKDINSIGSGTVTLNATGGDIVTKGEISGQTGTIEITSSNDIAINNDIRTDNTITFDAQNDINMKEDTYVSSRDNINLSADNINLSKISSKKTITMDTNNLQQTGDANSKVKLVADTVTIKSLDATAEANYASNPSDENKAKMVQVGQEDNLLEIKANTITLSEAEPFWHYQAVTNPTLDMTSNKGQYTNENFDVTFTFSDVVTGFALDDIILANGAIISDITTTNNIDYVISLKPKENFEGELQIDVGDDAAFDSDEFGNIEAIPFIINIDTISPTLVITDNKDDVTNQTITYTFTFSESTYEFNTSDIIVTNGTKSVTFTTGENGDTIYTINITPKEDIEGILSVSLGNSVKDIAGNYNIKSDVHTQAIDTLAPTVTITNNTTKSFSKTLEYTFEFSEAVYGFETKDIIVDNGTVSSQFIQGKDGDKIYKVIITPNDDFEGILNISIKEGVVKDKVSNYMKEVSILDEVNTSLYATYGKLVLENNIVEESKSTKVIDIKKDVIKESHETMNEKLVVSNEQSSLPKSIYMDIDEGFKVDNTMLPGFDLMSLKPVNLVDFNEDDEYMFEYWTNSLVI
jgi:hypothetical protein